MITVEKLKKIDPKVAKEFFDILMSSPRVVELDKFFLGKGSKHSTDRLLANKKISFDTLKFLKDCNLIRRMRYIDGLISPSSEDSFKYFQEEKCMIYKTGVFLNFERQKLIDYINNKNTLDFYDVYLCFHAHIYDLEYLCEKYPKIMKSIITGDSTDYTYDGVNKFAYSKKLKAVLDQPVFKGFTEDDLNTNIKNAYKFLLNVQKPLDEHVLNYLLDFDNVENVMGSYGNDISDYDPYFERKDDDSLINKKMNLSLNYVLKIPVPSSIKFHSALNMYTDYYPSLDIDSQKQYIKFIVQNSSEGSIKNNLRVYKELIRLAKDSSVVDVFYDEILKEDYLIDWFSKYFNGIFLRIILDTNAVNSIDQEKLKRILINNKNTYYIFSKMYSKHPLAYAKTTKNICFGNFWEDGCCKCMHYAKVKIIDNVKICKKEYSHLEDVEAIDNGPLSSSNRNYEFISSKNIRAYQIQLPSQVQAQDTLHEYLSIPPISDLP